MNVPKNYTADDFNTRCSPLQTKDAVNKKLNMLKDFGFINKKSKNEAEIRAWLTSLKTEEMMTRKLNPVVRFEKTLDEVMSI